MSSKQLSPYLSANNRLADVIAAIQAMATYRVYKLTFARWAKRIVGDPAKADHWRTVFVEHPEFFRLDTKRERASLVWRRQHRRRFDIVTGATLSHEEYAARRDRSTLSRTPLGASEVETLIEAAINLHSSALEHYREQRAWIPMVLSLLGVVLGAAATALGALAKQ